MKRKKPFKKKLVLYRRTIVDLSADEMREQRAGVGPSDKVVSCNTCPAQTCPPTTNANANQAKGSPTEHGPCATKTPFCL